jgi:hypothetical protein
MPKRDCNSGLDNRCRDNDGEIRHKRSDTLVGTLRQTYGEISRKAIEAMPSSAQFSMANVQRHCLIY